MRSRTNKECVGEDAGFIRLSTDEVREKLEEAIARVVLDGSRIILHQAGEEVAALIPRREFEKLDYLLEQMIPSSFNPDDEKYYEKFLMPQTFVAWLTSTDKLTSKSKPLSE